MGRILRQILIFVLIAVILFTNINISQAASVVRNNDFYQVKSEQESTTGRKDTANQKMTVDLSESTDKKSVQKVAVKKSSISKTVDQKNTMQKVTDEKSNISKPTDKGSDVQKAVAENSDSQETASEKQDKQEDNSQKDEGTTEESEEKDETKEEEQSTGTDEEVSTSEAKEVSEKTSTENTEQEKAEEATTELKKEQKNTGTDKLSQEEPGYSLRTVRPDTNHSVTMPDVTSHYFLLQKNSKKVSAASGANLAVVADAQAASKYIYESYPNGKQYNFTPRFTNKTVVKVGGGTGGGVSFATVKKGPQKQFGDVYDAVTESRIASKVFNLDKCSENPYAIYTNVGTWYDYSSKRTYAIDMKITVTGYKFPGAAVRKQLANQQLKAPYVGFTKAKVGMIVMGTDYLQTRLEFYYNGTTTAVSGIKGMIQFCDIDAQQGVDFGNGFEKIVMFKTAQTKLQYNKNGLIAGSKGYVSSRTSEDLNSNNEHTTAMGIFSGSSVNCRWTVAKCDQKDTGGNAAYGVSGGYGIPADSTIENSNSYYWSNSTGFLGVRADVGIAPLPEEVIKSIYAGKINGQNSEKGTKFLGLPERDTVFSYVLSAAAPTPSNVKNASYTAFQFEDSVDALLNVKSVKVYADEAVSNNFQTMGIQYSDMTSYFTITKKEEADHRTTVVVKALAARLTKAAFYGRTYYVHIEAEVKTDAQLHSIGRSIADWYQKDESIRQKVPEAGSCRGTVAVSNMGSLLAQNNKGSISQKKSNDVASKIAMRLSVKKLDEESGKPVKGVVFGLFGGESTEPLYRATTDENGVATFKPTSYTYYKEEFGDGPYYVKEISIPEKYKNVWNPSLNQNWSYKITTLKTEELFSSSISISEKQQLVNKNYEAKKHLVKVYKKSKDTGAYLSGAEFVLSEWSDSAGKYKELFTLEEAKDESGRPIYWNEKTFKNTLDNLGKYKITEKKAPKGCVLTGQEWGFTLSENTKEDGSNIIFENLATGKRQTAALIYRNPLQKGKIILTKKDDEGQVVTGATFTVKAAEDIYAPWDVDEQNKAEKDAEPLISKGTVADIITTGKDGKAESTSGNELYIGKYTVEETGGAIDHIKGDGIYEIELAYGIAADNPFVVYYLDASNRLMRPAFAVAKLADKTTNVEGKEVSFNEKTGRYTEKKKAGIYKAGEMVDYTIRVTNTGNVPLYQIRLTDDMDGKGAFAEQTLSKYVDMETATFVLPDSGILKTREGDKVAAKLSLESDLVVTLHHLNVNDSLDIHVRVQLKEEAKDAWQLRNDVYGEAKYNDNGKEEEGTGGGHLKEVPVENLIDGDGNSLIRDWDFINIPGEPGEKVTKTADKTTGVTIENGEITSGSKVPGIYNAAEKVKFSIMVKNNGEAALKNITVKDAMSEELRAIADMETAGFVFEQTETTEDGLYVLTTAGEKKITAKVIDKDTILLCSTGENGDGTDRLWSEDYIVLNYEVNLLPGIANFYNLSNKVYINGWYFDGNTDVEVPGQEDEDEIEVPGTPEGRTAKLADKTKGAVLEEGRYKAEAKISGVYENGNTVTYKITVTNKGTANLYDLYLKDTLSPELENALEKNSVSFEEKVYTSQDGREVRTILEEPQKLWMDFLGAKDSVDVFLKGKVRLDVGNLFELENLVELTARYKKGNEEAYKKYEEKVEKENKTWKLEYDANNGSNAVEIDSETPCQEGKRVTINGNPFSYPGYYFTGWNTKADGSGEMWKPDTIYTMPDKDVKLYAQWKKEKKEDEKDDGKEDGKNEEKEENSRKNPVYNLIYDSNNINNQVEADEENSQLAGVVLTVNKNHFSYPGFTFTGWNTRKDGQGKKYIEGDTLTMPAKDMILYAQWKKNPVYHLVYDANNESGMRRTDAETPCEEGTSIQIDGNSYHYEKGKDSYIFTGWNTRPDGQGEEYKAGEEKEIHADVILYAQWERLPENAEDMVRYHVFYRANNNTTAFSVDVQTPEEAGKEIVLEKNRFSYTDHVFTGWNTKADGSGKAYKPEEVFSVPSKDISLYAQWRKIERKTLVYSSNTKEEEKFTDAECFALNTMNTPSDTDVPVDKEKVIEIDGNAFHNKGLAFKGWNTSPDGTGKAYAPGEKFELKEDTILYAQWSQNVKTYALIYHSNYPADMDNRKEDQKEIDSETPAYAGTKVRINKNYFSCGGYMFMGWSTKKTGAVEYIPSQWYVMPEQDVNLYACWEKKPEEDKSDKKEDTEKPGEKEDTDDKKNDPDNKQDGVDDKKDDAKDDGLKDEENSDKDNDKDNGNADNKQDDNNKEDTNQKEEPLPEQTKKAIEQAYEEIQKLALKELKKESEKYTEIPVTELMKDTDIINIPGTPVTKVAKLADKTQGVTLIKGRYEGEKKEGIYEYGDIVDYTLNITNAGTADLYDLSVEDCMDNALLENIEKDSVQITVGELTTRQNNKVHATRMTEKEDKPGKYAVQIDCLKAGDSLELHIKGKIKSEVPANIGLNNTVHITAQYETVNDDGKREKVYVTDTPEMTDNDTVGIGVPEIRVAKKADKTKNITLEDGRYTGKRQYGTYKTGEEIKFTLTVSNRGTVAARKIKVKEEPSEELRKYVQMKGFTYKVGSSIKSKQKNTVKVEQCKNKAIFLDKIEAGDTVELIYTAKVKKDIPSIKCLKNEVTLTGKHKDGTEIPLTSKMKDYDKVNLKEDNKAEKGSQKHNTKGNGAKTGDNNNLLLWSALSILSLSIVMFLMYYKKRRDAKN